MTETIEPTPEPTDAEMLREVARALADRLDPRDDKPTPADDDAPTTKKEG